MNLNPFDIVLTVIIIAAVITALIIIVKNKRKGKNCSCSCGSCDIPCKNKQSIINNNGEPLSEPLDPY